MRRGPDCNPDESCEDRPLKSAPRLPADEFPLDAGETRLDYEDYDPHDINEMCINEWLDGERFGW